MDTVEGVCFPEGGMHPVALGLAAAADEGRGHVRLRHRGRPGGAPPGASGPVTGVRLADGEVVRGRRRRAQPDLPVAYRTLLPEVPGAPGRPHGATTRPSCVLWLAGVQGEPPAGAAAPQHPLRRPLAGLVRRPADAGPSMPDPSIAGDLPRTAPTRPWPRPGCTTLYVLEPVPNLDGTVDWQLRARAASGEDLARGSAALGYPVATTRWRALHRPHRLGARAWSGGPRSPWPTASSRPARSGPSTSTAALPGLVFAGSGTVPGVGVPMVLISGRLAAERVEALRGEAGSVGSAR